MHPSFTRVDHRPWPLPRRPWIGRQTWNDLLFLHWPVPLESLQPLVPEALTIEQFDDQAWVGVTPFWISNLGLRGLPPVPGASRFPELNVRTYVTLDDRPGVWFFSLDAAHRLAVGTARLFYHLPYVHARMSTVDEGGQIHYRSRRPSGVGFEARYAPVSPAAPAAPGTFEHWYAERYCLYAAASDGALYRGDIHHLPWPLQHAECEIERNTMLEVHGLEAAGPPVEIRFARRIEVAIWWPERIPRGVLRRERRPPARTPPARTGTAPPPGTPP